MAERLLIVGPPRAGKTTLAKSLSPAARSSDDAMHLGWSEASAEVASWFDAPGPWVIEGVAVVRALRKWLEAHPVTAQDCPKPCDRIVYLVHDGRGLSQGQQSMGKGIATVWREILSELRRRSILLEMRMGHRSGVEACETVSFNGETYPLLEYAKMPRRFG